MADERQDLILGAYGGGMDFFRLKGAVECHFEGLPRGRRQLHRQCRASAFHPGRCADVTANGQVVRAHWAKSTRWWPRITT